jgi:hypothetical protein
VFYAWARRVDAWLGRGWYGAQAKICSPAWHTGWGLLSAFCGAVHSFLGHCASRPQLYTTASLYFYWDVVWELYTVWWSCMCLWVNACMRSETWSAGARAWRGHTAGYTAGHDSLFVGCVKGILGVCCNARLSAPVFEASREYTFAGGRGGCFLAAWEARCTLLRCHFHFWGSRMVVDLPLLGISEGLSKLGVPK